MHDGITSIREEKEEDFSSDSSNNGEQALSPQTGPPHQQQQHHHHSQSVPHSSHGHVPSSHLPPPHHPAPSPSLPLPEAQFLPPSSVNEDNVHAALYAKYKQWSVSALKEHIKSLSLSSSASSAESDEVASTLRSAMEKKDLIELLIRLTPPTAAPAQPEHHHHAVEGHGSQGRTPQLQPQAQLQHAHHEAKQRWSEEGGGGGSSSAAPKLFTFTGASMPPSSSSSLTSSAFQTSSPASYLGSSTPASGQQVSRFSIVSPASQVSSLSGEHSPPLDSPVLPHFERPSSLPTGVTYSASADDLSKMSRAGARASAEPVRIHHINVNGDELKAFDPLFDDDAGGKNSNGAGATDKRTASGGGASST